MQPHLYFHLINVWLNILKQHNEKVNERFLNKIQNKYFLILAIANLATRYKSQLLTADDGAKYDRIIDINLSEVKKKNKMNYSSYINYALNSLNHMLMGPIHLI